MIPCKIVMVGDSNVGKTAFLFTYIGNRFPEEHSKLIFNDYSANVTVENQTVQMHLWDTAGASDYDRLRPLTYPDTNLVLLSYRINDPDSFNNITEKWLPEITKHCPGAPYILVATQTDGRENQESIERLAAKGKSCVTTEQGHELSLKIKAAGFFEVCATKVEGVRETMDAALKVWVAHALAGPDAKHKKGDKERCLVQ